MDGSNQCMQEIIRQIQIKLEGHWNKIVKINQGEILDAQDQEIITANLIRMNLMKEVNKVFLLKTHLNRIPKKTVTLQNLLSN